MNTTNLKACIEHKKAFVNSVGPGGDKTAQQAEAELVALEATIAQRDKELAIRLHELSAAHKCITQRDEELAAARKEAEGPRCGEKGGTFLGRHGDADLWYRVFNGVPKTDWYHEAEDEPDWQASDGSYQNMPNRVEAWKRARERGLPITAADVKNAASVQMDPPKRPKCDAFERFKDLMKEKAISGTAVFVWDTAMASAVAELIKREEERAR